MQQIISFFIKRKDFFVFLLLFAFALKFIFNSNLYQQSTFINSSNRISGVFYGFTDHWRAYFNLREQNEILTQENETLRNEIAALKHHFSQGASSDSIAFLNTDFTFTKAKVIKNSVLLHKNYLTLNRGEKYQITQDMGVISSKGLVGIVENTSENFATVQSVLNLKSSLNAEVKKTKHFGSLRWNGDKINIVQLTDIPNIAPIAIGDTIITGGMSKIFPKGIPIGKIIRFENSKEDNSYVIDVELFTDMSNVEYVYIISNKNKEEIINLERQTDE
ncbi:rod shape-determining protein MreC [Capnocytophaga canimorsus]|uniref:Cell shape-determining protein MreC n=2 Tax=Capnocytophaga canimorsus TaxID=28188 RepID=A0A250G335_9FLAO|nr:rod shape-determining protein MreC [Capnocytophaga canimorsus]ATA91800.1 rod shape-determining protein MreC [Capnocytophaga canimorsus]